MILKTFLATYLLFVFIFFSSMGIVSVYMTNSQLEMLREKSGSEFRTISATLAKDLAVLSGRVRAEKEFDESVSGLMEDYRAYYRKNNISLELEILAEGTSAASELAFMESEQGHFISVSGGIAGAFWNYRLEYSSDITENISALGRIRNILLLLAVTFSVAAAFALYIILSGIFRPLTVVSKTSGKIAAGLYSERIIIKGRGELSKVAEDFNSMAAQIEKHIEALEKESVQKQQFVDSFAHEIRTPLTSVYGYADYILSARLSEEEILESAQAVKSEASYIKKIADSLLELATLRNTPAEKMKIPLPPLLEGVALALRGLDKERSSEIVCSCAAEFIYAQEDLLRSLLLNLGFNALKACPQEGGIIQLKAEETNMNTILTVSDNGCGIPEESLSRLEEPFYRVDKARSRESGGAGLGLSLCRQIAEAHGAKLKINSAIGEGTRVEIIFTSS